MLTTTSGPSADRGGSKHHSAAAFWNILLAALFAASLHAQTAGSITVTAMPANAHGASAMDASGNLYIGTTNGGGAPVTTGAAQTQFGGNACNGGSGSQIAQPKIGLPFAPPACDDAYLTKVDPNGNTVYATFLGGPLNDGASALTVDSAGNLYVTGTTGGSFPTTANSAIATSSSRATFAAKLNKTGSSFLYVTYLPPTIASVSAIAIDGQGNAYVSGQTASGHAVVIEVSADGSFFPHTTTLAGSGQESANSVVVDSSGDVIVSGLTNSPDFPVTLGVIQPKLAGAHDQFIVKLDAAGNIIFSTYLGGSGDEQGASLQTDLAGNIYITGLTRSIDFPTTAGSFRATPAIPLGNNASPGGFLTSISPDGHIVRYSTYILTADGAASPAGPAELTVGAAGDVYVLDAALASWPVTASAPQPCYNGGADAFLAHFDTNGQLADSTYLGQVSQNVSLPANNYLPRDGTVMIISTSAGNHGPAMVDVRFGEPGWTAPACLTPMVLNGATLTARGQVVAPGEVVSLVGNGIGPPTGVVYQPSPIGGAPRVLGGVQVLFGGIQAPIIYAQSNQVNAFVPVELAGQTSATVTVQYQNVVVGTFTQQLAAFDPAIFRANPGFSSQAAALNQDFTVNGPSHPAPAGSYVSIWATGLGPLTSPCSDGNLNVNAAVYLASGYSTVINGQSSINVPYSGAAPLLLCGVMQMNIQIPIGTPSGNFAIYPWANYNSGNTSISSQSSVGATVVVK